MINIKVDMKFNHIDNIVQISGLSRPKNSIQFFIYIFHCDEYIKSVVLVKNGPGDQKLQRSILSIL